MEFDTIQPILDSLLTIVESNSKILTESDSINSSILSIVFGLFWRLVSGFLFLFAILYWMRPKIKISPEICHYKIGDSDSYWYVFKIVNYSRYQAYDLKINLQGMAPDVVNDGMKINNRFVHLKKSSDHLDQLPRIKKKKEGYGNNAYLIRTDVNIESYLEEKNKKIMLTVISKHGLTNLTKVETQIFTNIKSVKKDHEFIFGTNLTTTKQ